jgi:hypothetical protein
MKSLDYVVLVLAAINVALNAILLNWTAAAGWFVATLYIFRTIMNDRSQ